MKELWKQIHGTNYEVSNMGRVRHIYSKHIKGTRVSPYGYLRMNIKKMGVIKTLNVHRLVAEAFIPNLNNYPVINHKDENKLNNCADNLEWCTNKYNVTYGGAVERAAKGHWVPVVQADISGNVVAQYSSIKEAAQKTMISYTGISDCCKGKQHISGGYEWRRA